MRLLRILLAAVLGVIALAAGAFVIAAIAAAFVVFLIARTLVRRLRRPAVAPSAPRVPASDDVIDITATEVRTDPSDALPESRAASDRPSSVQPPTGHRRDEPAVRR